MNVSKIAGLLAGCAIPFIAGAAQAQALTSADLLRAADGRLPQFLACLKEHRTSVIGAHRGGPLPEHPENAIVTMTRTGNLVPVFMETDVQQSSDGVLFQNHDDVLDRNTTGKGKIADQTWAQISKLKQRDTTAAPTIYAPPLLSEVLDWAKDRSLLLLDVKPNTDPALVIGEVEKAKADGRVMYLAYTIEEAQGFRKLRPDAIVALPMFDRANLEAAKAAGLMDHRLLAMVRPAAADAAFIRDVEQSGALIMSGTYGGPKTPDAVYVTTKDAQAFQAMTKPGARFLVSNRPVEAAQALMADPAYVAKLKTCGVVAKR